MLQKDLLNLFKNDKEEAIDITQNQFLFIDQNLLNAKPSVDKWSIAECISHLNITLEIYIPQMKAVIDHPEKYPAKKDCYRHSLLGRLAAKVIKPKANKEIPYKMKTFNGLNPEKALENPTEEIKKFLYYQNEILRIVDGLQNVDLNKAKITTAIGPLLKMQIGDALHFMIAHNQRHILQAQNVLKIIQ